MGECIVRILRKMSRIFGPSLLSIQRLNAKRLKRRQIPSLVCRQLVT